MDDLLPEAVVDAPPDEDVEFFRVIETYWADTIAEMEGMPIMKLYMSGVYKMAHEYQRLKDTIEDMNTQVIELGTSPQLTNERARLRDNIASMTTEGWKLLDSILGNLHKIQGTLKKNGDDSGPADIFEAMQAG